MLENLNHALFSLSPATPDSAPWMISLAIFLAKDLITVVPLLAAVVWLWGLTAQRQLVIKIALAL
ncbi:undecaprenyl-diphosphate phosphatase, partial [Escherichia coli]